MRSKLPLLLIATGIFVPLVSVPFAEGYRRNAGVIENIQSMSFLLTPDRYTPDFRAIDLTSLPDAAPSPSSQERGFTDAEVGLATPSKQEDSARSSPKPPFNPSKPFEVVTVAYGNTGINVFFASSISEDEIKNVLKSGKQQIESANSKNLRFYGWTLSRQALRLPFSFVVSGSLLLVFVGVIMLILSRRPT